MEHSSPQQGSETQQASGLLAGLQFFDGILKWLVGLFRLTDKEQEDAGIYLGNQDYK
jgi:hypothetical protein